MLEYIVFSSTLAIVGIIGFVLLRSHGLLMLICLELIILSIVLNFIVSGWFFYDMIGQLNVLFVLTIAVAESSIGLAFLIMLYRFRGLILIDSIKGLKS